MLLCLNISSTRKCRLIEKLKSLQLLFLSAVVGTRIRPPRENIIVDTILKDSNLSQKSYQWLHLSISMILRKVNPVEQKSLPGKVFLVVLSMMHQVKQTQHKLLVASKLLLRLKENKTGKIISKRRQCSLNILFRHLKSLPKIEKCWISIWILAFWRQLKVAEK